MNKEKSPAVLVRLALCVLILVAGVGGFMVLKKMKKPPQRVAAHERVLAVHTIRVQPQSITVSVHGYGEIRSRTVVPLSAEVAGRITFIHQRLEAGDVIGRGGGLLRIDDRDYRADYESARDRLTILRRDRKLAENEFKRVQTLFATKKVGTLSAVEKAESALNSVSDRIRQLEKTMQLAGLKLERCVIRAPFACRLTEIEIEKDEYVTPGRKLLTITDDTDLEIVVSLDSRDAVNLLRYRAGRERTRGWFEVPEQVQCRISWTENRKIHGTGQLDRVVRFDPQTRTVFVAVRLARQQEEAFPLVDGMFCEVVIPGRTLHAVFVLPRQAVTFENGVYLVRDGRLQSRQVSVVRREGERAIIDSGLAAGDMVITTRLQNPLENSLVRVIGTGQDGK